MKSHYRAAAGCVIFHFVRSFARRANCAVARTFFDDAKISKKKFGSTRSIPSKNRRNGAIVTIFGPFEDLQGLKGCLETSEMPIWRSYEFLSVTSRFVSKNYPRHPEIHLSRILDGGVKR